MKLIIFLAVCVFATNAVDQVTFSELTQIWQRFLLKHIDECVAKTGVDRVLAERFIPYGEYVDDPKLKCFVRCIGATLIMVDNGKAHYQHYLDILNIHDPKIQKDLISQCFEKIDEEDECVHSFNISKCVYFTVKMALTGKGEPVKKDSKNVSEL